MNVDPEEVRRIIDALRAAAGSVLPRRGTLGDSGVAGQELADILATTEETWAAELATQEAALTALADFLAAALESFTAVDTSLAAAAEVGS